MNHAQSAALIAERHEDVVRVVTGLEGSMGSIATLRRKLVADLDKQTKALETAGAAVRAIDGLDIHDRTADSNAPHRRHFLAMTEQSAAHLRDAIAALHSARRAVQEISDATAEASDRFRQRVIAASRG